MSKVSASSRASDAAEGSPLRLTLLGEVVALRQRLDRPAWLSGSRRADVTGPVALILPDDPPLSCRVVSASGAGTFSGQQADCVELV